MQSKKTPPLHLMLIVSGANGGDHQEPCRTSWGAQWWNKEEFWDLLGEARHPLCKEVLIHLQGARNGEGKLEKLRGADVHKGRAVWHEHTLSGCKPLTVNISRQAFLTCTRAGQGEEPGRGLQWFRLTGKSSSWWLWGAISKLYSGFNCVCMCAYTCLCSSVPHATKTVFLIVCKDLCKFFLWFTVLCPQ